MQVLKILKDTCKTLEDLNHARHKSEEKIIVDNTYYFIIEEYNQESSTWYDLEDVYED